MTTEIKHFWGLVSNLGTYPEMSQYEKDNHILINRIAFLVVLVQTFVIIFKIIIAVDLIEFFFELCSICGGSLVLYLNYIHKHNYATIVGNIYFIVLTFIVSIFSGESSGISIIYLPLILTSLILHRKNRIRFFLVALLIVLYAAPQKLDTEMSKR